MTDDMLSEIKRLRENEHYTWHEVGLELGLSGEAARGRYRRANADKQPVISNARVADESWEEILEAASNMQSVLEEAEYWDRGEVDVEIQDIESDNIILTLTSDWHIGDKTCYMWGLRSDVESWLSVPDLKVFVVGDMIENGIGTQGTQAATEQIISPEMQHLVARGILTDLYSANKLLGTTSGNHSDRSGRVLFETYRWLVQGLNVPTFGNKGVVNLTLNDITYKMSVGHKLPGMTATNPFGAHLRRMRESVIPDISAIGHVHTWNYAVIPVHGNEMHMCTLGSYVEQEYAVRFYNSPLKQRNHYFVLGTREKTIRHYSTLLEALEGRQSARFNT